MRPKLGDPLLRDRAPGQELDLDLVWCQPDGRPIDPHDDWADWKVSGGKIPAAIIH